MSPARFVQERSPSWDELDQMLVLFEGKAARSRSLLLKFARLYRSACTDLSLAAAFRLSRQDQSRLEDLVARGHTVLYSVPRRSIKDIWHYVVSVVPAAVRADIHVKVCLLLFFVPFFLCGILAYNSRAFAAAVAGEAVLESYQDMHNGAREPLKLGDFVGATGFYIANNVGIDLITFGLGALGGIGSIFFCLYNAVYLGTIIGFLLNTPAQTNIISWIAGHAAFELTAVALSAAAGMRIGFALLAPGTRTRMLAIREEALASMPVMFSAALLTFLAAFLEAFLGPLEAPIPAKMAVGLSALLAMCAYFLLGGRK